MSFQTLQRQAEFRFFIPGDGRHLQRALGVGVEDRAAEHQADGNISVRQTVEILGSRDVEIEGAGHL